MSTAASDTYGGHPVSALVARFRAELAALVDTGLWSIGPAELASRSVGVPRSRQSDRSPTR